MPTAIGNVVPALASVLTTALAAEPTRVLAGPKPTSAYATEYLCVGFDPDGSSDGVDSTQKPSDLGNRWIDEAGDVTCAIICWSGDDDTAPLLTRADYLLDLADAALRADPTLGGVLVPGADDGSYARVLGRVAYRPAVTSSGAVAQLTFTVHYSSLLT